ncbi:MAG: phosphoribosylamine--glycine ligase [Candidatus Woesearchaeota archaeon]|jgi:phosphoribosylamine--glycine ligase|nr:phosphoribosylamine--glycine ligase [Candidatus Woesearchaeota archaeon]MDP7622803.1 phosphoribosylamine--glycine ligase [Candidatus Woesearchaeota archaeon]HJN56938.1 phosphoribosylamine--glycine ligase [Candidatus Woesearchaeota archaeon]|tara:strand:- start:77602 stop:78906 length:1305 start_codon:yes stop_codon:yes gene_type:complete
MNILLLGHGARENVIAETIRKSSYAKLFSYMKSNNPGIAALSEKIEIGSYSDMDKVKDFAKKNNVDFAFIGPEDPLSFGVVDVLQSEGIDAIGPVKMLAKLETSKSFTRNLLQKHEIEGNPKFMVFGKENIDEIDDFLNIIEGIVVKPDGLTGGKGVKVQGDHFNTKKEAVAYCKEVLEKHESVVVEEKLDGEEFSLQCLTDGKTVLSFPAVQDHKRAYEDDKGPNTGGMGSYSCENLLLPFLKKEHVNEALKITKKVVDAIYSETGTYYKGIMYGGFILTKDGVKLIEYNARFGDPEAMNVLPLLKTELAGICQAIIAQDLGKLKIEFKKKATVCKYAVPEGYPDNPVKNEKIEIQSSNAKIYYASVDKKQDGLYMTGSRAVAFLGIGDNLEEAEKIAEEAVSKVKGKVFHRKDIGTKELIGKKVEHIKRIVD